MKKSTFLAIDDVRSRQQAPEITDAILKSRATSFYEKSVGLYYVNANQLYKPQTFEQWVEENLEIGSSQAYNYIWAYELLTDMASWPSVTNLPSSEYQCRMIREFNFPQPVVEVAWRRVEERLPKERLSGRLIESCFNEQVKEIKREDPVSFESVVAGVAKERQYRLQSGLWSRPRGYADWEWDLSDGDIDIPLRPVGSSPQNMTIFVRVSSVEQLDVVKMKAKITPNWLLLACMEFNYPSGVYAHRPQNLILGAVIQRNDDVDRMLELSQHESVRTFAIFDPEEPLDAGVIADWLIFSQMDITSFVTIFEQIKSHQCIFIPENCIVGRHQFLARAIMQNN